MQESQDDVKVKKICIATLILACFLLSATLISAHPGRTDEDGGHYVAGTSEYHYHHGSPAHNHYDMDGDGDKDCPHNFDDKSGWNSGNSTNSKTTSYTSTKPPTAPSKFPVWAVPLIFVVYLFWLKISY
jgi:hypothetical protein